MAFKSVEEFNEERYRNLFRLTDDGMSADVVFLYQSKRDMLQADVHYVKSPQYNGYVHCLGEGCPACRKGLRVQSKLFIPVYNIEKNAIEFWDRNMNNGFVGQLEKEVFNIYPNPSEVVYKISRKGGYRDQETRYSFVAVGKNSSMPYAQILARFNATMPEYYENIVKTVSFSELTEMLQNNSDTSVVTQDYIPTPRAGYQSSIPDTFVNASDAVNNSSEEPNSDDPILSQFDDNGDEGSDELPDPVF